MIKLGAMSSERQRLIDMSQGSWSAQKRAYLIVTYLVLFAGVAAAMAGAAAFGVRCLRLGPAELLVTPVHSEVAPAAYQFLEVSIASLRHGIKLGDISWIGKLLLM